MFSKLVLVSIFFSLFANLSFSQTRSYFRFYENETVDISNFYIQTSYDESNLTRYGNLHWIDTPEHLFVYNGAGVLYETEDFGGRGWPAEYCIIDANTTCERVMVRSLRSYRLTSNLTSASAPVINLFTGVNYLGDHLMYGDSIADVDFEFSSIFRVGNELWRIFLLPNYQGLSYCVTSTTIANITASTGISPGQFRSIRKEECTAKSDFLI